MEDSPQPSPLLRPKCRAGFNTSARPSCGLPTGFQPSRAWPSRILAVPPQLMEKTWVGSMGVPSQMD